MKMLAGVAARGDGAHGPPRCQHRAVGRGGRERFGHPPVLLPVPRPASRSYFGQGKQDGSHTPPPPLLPPSFLQEKPHSPAMPAGRGLPRPGLGHHGASASPASSSSSPATPRSPPGPFPPAAVGRQRRSRGPSVGRRSFPNASSICLAPPASHAAAAQALAARWPPSPAVCGPWRQCRATRLAAGPRGAPLEPPLPDHSGADAGSLLSPRSTQPPCPSPVAVEPPRSPSQSKGGWRGRGASVAALLHPSGARHGTARHASALAAAQG